MNSQERTLHIRMTILGILCDCNGYLLPETALQTHLLAAVPDITLAEAREQLAWLEAEGMAMALNPGLGGPKKWTYTDKGRLAHAQAQNGG